MDVRLILQKGAAQQQVLHLRSAVTLVGRGKDCKLRIPSAKVSREHCVLRFHDGVLSVEDLQSANGTFLNNNEIKGKQVVRPGDRLGIGPVQFLVQYHLGQKAINRLLGEEEIPEVEVAEVVSEDELDVEMVEEESAVEVIVLPDDDPPPETAELAIIDTKTHKPLPPVKKPPSPPPRQKPKPAATIPVEEEEFNRLPADGDLRDILSQIDDE